MLHQQKQEGGLDSSLAVTVAAVAIAVGGECPSSSCIYSSSLERDELFAEEQPGAEPETEAEAEQHATQQQQQC